MRPWWLALLCASTASAADPTAILGRVLLKVQERIKVMPNYTCVETLTRDTTARSCPERRCDVLLE